MLRDAGSSLHVRAVMPSKSFEARERRVVLMFSSGVIVASLVAATRKGVLASLPVSCLVWFVVCCVLYVVGGARRCPAEGTKKASNGSASQTKPGRSCTCLALFRHVRKHGLDRVLRLVVPRPVRWFVGHLSMLRRSCTHLDGRPFEDRRPLDWR